MRDVVRASAGGVQRTSGTGGVGRHAAHGSAGATRNPPDDRRDLKEVLDNLCGRLPL